jgi:hypothetical protein
MADTNHRINSVFDGLNVPVAVITAINGLRDELIRTAGSNLAGLILYGGLARGRYRPGKSDVNIVVLLHDTSVASLATISPVLRAGWRAVRAEPLILALSEIHQTADAFPAKFLDIQTYHLVLVGEDPFLDLKISRESLRLRIEQELRNLTLRLRRRYVSVIDDPVALAETLAKVARSFSIELATLLHLAGKEVPTEDRAAVIFEAAATAFNLDGEALARIAAFRRNTSTEDDLPVLYNRLLVTITRAVEIADQMEVSS